MDQTPPGLFGSVRKLGGTILAAAHNRIELFAVEIQIEKCRLVEILLWACAAIFLGTMAVAWVTFTILIYFWETAKVPALVGISIFYVLTAGTAFYGLKSRLRKGPRPFHDTLDQIKKDQEWLHSGK